ncbi:MAG: hypothetical protein ACUZ8O_11000 [Candidatus Anammoxibacter sp.]
MEIEDMRNLMMVCVMVVMSGCASTGGQAVPYGKDTFNITKSNYGSYPKLRSDTIQAANSHCQSIGKLFSPVEETKSSIDGGFARIYTLDLTFRCLSEDDPSYRRPDVKVRPDIVIESK